MEARPTTLYVMLGERCAGACLFCAQARDSSADPKFLSRVVWPAFDLDTVLDRLKSTGEARRTGDVRRTGEIRRICIQTLWDAALMPHLVETVARMRSVTDVPISICMNPTDPSWLPKLKAAGVDRVGIGLDCATEETFERIKPGFNWQQYHQFLDKIVEVFGTGSVHLIVGLGDSDAALVRKMQEARDHRCYVALFAFTPVRGARLDREPPDPGRYRALQLARHLVISGRARYEDMTFEDERLTGLGVDPTAIERALETGTAFRTSGCPDCNRPLYNERPGGPMYNYACQLTEADKTTVRQELATYLSF
jgi:biotin synthase